MPQRTPVLHALELAPAGVLRASINLGNPVLARKDPQSAQVGGVSVDLAQSLAEELGVGLELQVYDAAAKSVEAVRSGQADIGFFAIDPLRGEGIAFTAPYVLIEGAYLVREAAPYQSNEQVDRTGTTVVVGKGSAYDLFLSRELKAATILRAPTPAAVLPLFIEQNAQVAAGIRPQLADEAARRGGLRLLPGRFMVIEQAMGLPADRAPAARARLRDFIERAKASGFVAQALARHAIGGALVAPAAAPAPAQSG
jgi:polar amino acid transport system substrate-binding protein